MIDLQALADAINRKWWRDGNASIDEFDGWISFGKPNCQVCYGHGWEDASCADWIIWCLDRLEELGWRVQLLTCGELFMVGDAQGEHGDGREAEGFTRAEAVTNALAVALGVGRHLSNQNTQ